MTTADEAIGKAAEKPLGVEEAIKRASEEAYSTRPRDLTPDQMRAVVTRARQERLIWEDKEERREETKRKKKAKSE